MLLQAGEVAKHTVTKFIQQICCNAMLVNFGSRYYCRIHARAALSAENSNLVLLKIF